MINACQQIGNGAWKMGEYNIVEATHKGELVFRVWRWLGASVENVGMYSSFEIARLEVARLLGEGLKQKYG